MVIRSFFMCNFPPYEDTVQAHPPQTEWRIIDG